MTVATIPRARTVSTKVKPLLIVLLIRLLFLILKFMNSRFPKTIKFTLHIRKTFHKVVIFIVIIESMVVTL